MTDDDETYFGDLFGEDTLVSEPEILTPLMYTRTNGCGSIVITTSSKRHSLWGHMLWHAAEETAERLEKMNLSGKTVLELGAGMGLPGLVCALSPALRVVITDYDEEVLLNALRRNAINNCAFALDAGLVSVVGLTWGNYDHIKRALALNGGKKFDIIILSDLIFNHICHDALAETIRECLDKDGLGLCCFTHHRPRKVKDDMNFFEKSIPNAGLKSTKIDTKMYDVMFPEEEGDVEQRSIVHVYEIHHDIETATVDQPLPSDEIDVVLQGTNVDVSLMAGALARSGKRVLHVDENEFYGGEVHATLTWRQFRKHVLLNNWEEYVHTNIAKFGERQFNIDLTPSVIMANGDLAQFLIRSGIARYLEFKVVDRLIVYNPSASSENMSRFISVPLSKGDLFRSRILSLTEKRIMMKILTELSSDQRDIVEECRRDEVLGSYLQRVASTCPRLQEWLQYVILECDETTVHTMKVSQATARLQKFVASVGKFGSTPYLMYVYGSGELAQACCRVGALYNGIYALRQKVTNLLLPSQSEDVEHARKLTVNIGPPPTVITPAHFVACAKNDSKCSRALLLLRSPLVSWDELEASGDKAMDDDEVSLRREYVAPTSVVTFPPHTLPEVMDYVVRAVQVTHNTEAVPRGLIGVHFISHAPLESLKSAIRSLVENIVEPGNILYECYWILNEEACVSGESDLSKSLGKNVHFACPRDPLILHDDGILMSSQDIFQNIMASDSPQVANVDFYPQLPNAEYASGGVNDEMSMLLGVDIEAVRQKMKASNSNDHCAGEI